MLAFHFLWFWLWTPLRFLRCGLIPRCQSVGYIMRVANPHLMDVSISGLLERPQRLPSRDSVNRSSMVQLTCLENRIVLPRCFHRCIPVLGSVKLCKLAISAERCRNFAWIELGLALFFTHWLSKLDELLFQRRWEQRPEL